MKQAARGHLEREGGAAGEREQLTGSSRSSAGRCSPSLAPFAPRRLHFDGDPTESTLDTTARFLRGSESPENALLPVDGERSLPRIGGLGGPRRWSSPRKKGGLQMPKAARHDQGGCGREPPAGPRYALPECDYLSMIGPWHRPWHVSSAIIPC